MKIPLRYPRWGIRIHCEKIPDGSKNMYVPRNYSFLLCCGIYVSHNSIPKVFQWVHVSVHASETMKTLFSSFDRVFSSDLEESVTDALQLNDTFPSTVDVNGTALTGIG